jgi:hypothetical protein
MSRVLPKTVSDTMRSIDPMNSARGENFPYSGLARNLLSAISHSDLPETDKKLLREELFRTISGRNRIWAQLILKENQDGFERLSESNRNRGARPMAGMAALFTGLMMRTPPVNDIFQNFILKGCRAMGRFALTFFRAEKLLHYLLYSRRKKRPVFINDSFVYGLFSACRTFEKKS